MGIIDTSREVLDLLKEANGDLVEWVEYAEEYASELELDYTKDLISRIISVLHKGT